MCFHSGSDDYKVNTRTNRDSGDRNDMVAWIKHTRLFFKYLLTHHIDDGKTYRHFLFYRYGNTNKKSLIVHTGRSRVGINIAHLEQTLLRVLSNC